MGQFNLSTREFGKVLLDRMKGAGLQLRPDLQEDNLRIPVLPDGLMSNLSYENADGHHCCEQHRIVCIPLVLVVDFLVPEIVDDPENHNRHIWQTRQSFDPYWLINVTVIHDWVPYPNREHRCLNVLESACVLAQHPYLGSVQSHQEPRGWGHGRIQVYYSPNESNCIIASRLGIPGYNHHAAFATGIFSFPAPMVEPRIVPRKELVEVKKALEVPPPVPAEAESKKDFNLSLPGDGPAPPADDDLSADNLSEFQPLGSSASELEVPSPPEERSFGSPDPPMDII